MSYNAVAQLPASKKYTLAWVEPSERLSLWNLHSGAVYSRSVSHLVTSVSQNDTNLTEGSSSTLSQGEWFLENGVLYSRMTDDSNPESSFMVATYRIFFSDIPVNLPYDLSTGHEVHYDSLIKSISNFPIGLDQDQIGQAIESSGSISFYHNDFWVDNFDHLIWENKSIKIFSYLEGIDVADIKTMFQGEITAKIYNSSGVGFTMKDPLHKLRQTVSSSLYSSSDGDISDDVIGTPKRVIFGKVENLRAQSLDQVLDGYSLTGTISVTLDSTSLSGSSTLFLKELSPNDELTFQNQFGTEYSYRVETIASDTSLTLTEEAEETIGGASVAVTPEVPYRYKNREYQVSGHKLREPTTTLSANSTQLNRINMTSVEDFLVNDLITVGAETATIKRISGSVFILTQNLDSLPLSGTAVSKKPISAVYFSTKKMVIDRDYTTTQNTTSGCKITLEDNAEMNVVLPKKLSGTTTFTNSSLDVTGANTQFESQLVSRDWIISSDINHQTWYEVLEVVDDTNLKLRIAYAGTNENGNAKRKNVEYISDESIVTVDCIGKESDIDGSWVRTASDSVKELLYLADITNIDADSFTASDVEAPYIVSLRLPLDFGSEMPTIKTAVSYINQSVFGSLVNKSNFKLSYNILNPDRPSSTVPAIKDDDIISWSVSTKADTYRKIVGRYNHKDNERYSLESASTVYEFESDFVDRLNGTQKEKEVNIYLHEQNCAETITQRYAYFHSLAQGIIKIKGGGLSLSNKELNDKIYIQLDKLYKRFGGNDLAKVVVINAVRRNGTTYDVDCNDMSNWFSRTGAISEDTAQDFTNAPDSEKILSGYIVDDDTELPGITEYEINTNLIG